MRRLGAGGDQAGLFSRLAAAYAEPHRAYHSTTHLVDCLKQLDEAAVSGGDRDVVEAAIWFHDAVYDPRRLDNESRSADWAERAARDAGLGPGVAAEMARLVLLTRHDAPATDPSGRLLTDVDLSILGRETAVFDQYEREIRKEYAWVAEPEYRAARAGVLARFLARDPLFLTEHFRSRYEAPARGNLRRTLDRLGSRSG